LFRPKKLAICKLNVHSGLSIIIIESGNIINYAIMVFSGSIMNLESTKLIPITGKALYNFKKMLHNSHIPECVAFLGLNGLKNEGVHPVIFLNC